jgi:hypothetical protein
VSDATFTELANVLPTTQPSRFENEDQIFANMLSSPSRPIVDGTIDEA